MRVRITATVALMAALALAGAGLIVYAIQSERVAEQSASEVDQEIAEFAALVDRQGNNPDTGEPFVDIREMLRLFLERNVPDDDELLVAWYDGGPALRNPNSPVAEDPGFEAAVREIVTTGGSREIQTPDDGPALVTVQPVSDGADTGAMAVGTLVERL